MEKLEQMLYEMLKERKNDGVVKDILGDHETTEDFSAVLKDTTKDFIRDNFNTLYEFTLLKWVQILDEEEDERESLNILEGNIEEFISSDPEEVDVLQMKAMMEDS